ncbi:Plasma membrane proteolipid 3 [Pseudocercospora fuligena]|uniref:Plasma membrane proteolipid 3 n=1 Tax=Pseudocercospora fuligena TaxID=685502 RepID=A0A8H6R6K7_9PEZI|nr:Plasma membrane proteolipid 3 [Pseudocercospora fuligena]
MPFTGSDIIKIILAILLPPLGVFLERGCGADLLINILLTILGYIPGIIHALYVSSNSMTSGPLLTILPDTSSSSTRLRARLLLLIRRTTTLCDTHLSFPLLLRDGR